MAITYESMLARHELARVKAERIRRDRHARGIRLAVAAGIGESIGTTGHNAMIDYRAGKPWPGVDYSLLRQAFRTVESSYLPGRYLSRLWTRLYEEWRAGGFRYDSRAGS